MDSLTDLRQALEAVVHVPLNVNEGEGETLADKYKVGNTYPVFILANSDGEVITRWTGYTGGANALIRKLKSSLADVVSVDDRLGQFERAPTFADALKLAKYYADINENLKAVDFYREARRLNTSNDYDYSYEIFFNTANASWKDEIPISDVYPQADAVLNATRKNKDHIIKVAEIMTRLARKNDNFEHTDTYLQAGIDAASSLALKETTVQELRADYALHITGDTATAIQIKKAAMGPGWDQERNKFYSFSKWCLERKTNLDEAETFARKTVSLVYPGTYRGMVLNTVAEICDARGKTHDAIKIIQLAIKEDPDNDFYQEQLARFRSKLSDK